MLNVLPVPSNVPAVARLNHAMDAPDEGVAETVPVPPAQTELLVVEVTVGIALIEVVLDAGLVAVHPAALV